MTTYSVVYKMSKKNIAVLLTILSHGTQQYKIVNKTRKNVYTKLF